MRIKNLLSALAMCAFAASCSGGMHGNDDEVRTAVDSFATAYFNYDFKKAIVFCTNGSEKWLHFAASNVLQEDIDTLKSQTAKAVVETGDIDYLSDSVATVSCEVTNFLLRDTLGRPGHMEKKMTFKIPVKRNGGSWAVDAGGLMPEGRYPDKG